MRPRPAPGTCEPPWQALANEQDGVVSRAQLVGLGVTDGGIAAQLRARRWTRLLPGVYATFTGAVTDAARVRAAVLYVGGRCAVGGAAALWLCGVVPVLPTVVTVCVPSDRRVRDQPGVQVVTRARWDEVVHPAGGLPRLRLEDALLDVTQGQRDVTSVVGLVLRATQGRYTTAARIREALARRGRHRWRRLLDDLLADVEDGVQSPLELRWARDVERRHGLPRGERNQTEVSPRGRRRYRDVRYRRWGVVVELDGREAHPDHSRFRDRARDNEAAEAGEVALRYGWREVAAEPCVVAAQVVRVLRRLGWRGTPRPCGRGCALTRAVAALAEDFHDSGSRESSAS